MNSYQDEMTAEYNRQRIIAEMKQIRLEQLALRGRVYQPSRFAHIMFAFANWMIAAGKQLRKRYEIPSAKCNQVASTKRFAH